MNLEGTYLLCVFFVILFIFLGWSAAMGLGHYAFGKLQCS